MRSCIFLLVGIFDGPPLLSADAGCRDSERETLFCLDMRTLQVLGAFKPASEVPRMTHRQPRSNAILMRDVNRPVASDKHAKTKTKNFI